MSPEILTISTPLSPPSDAGAASTMQTIETDLDGDGVLERVEIDDMALPGRGPFREWRVIRGGRVIHSCAGVDITVRNAADGRAVIVSDGGLWHLSERFGMIPYGDLLSARTQFMQMGTAEDRDALDAAGATGIFRENVQVITADLTGARHPHRVLAGSGFAFMDEETDTALFLITTHDHRPLLSGRSAAHPWVFRNRDGFTVIGQDRFGFQISLLPEGVL
ncbi:hypothetical protein IQ03_01262 [Gemmobacter caeni]|jgi:hypothetical protein|uniref:EF-hand domain-containing protein n=1 Tax=Gemmobacter caeni TaxID=589035 RepID=A0A2T6B8U0_9RHOB|nr:hypothetical protein [Gemmobacter caeni]PTX52485.1 hypothetical protein C8N34_102265 [Gemmobacter caeni]TWJ02844.1 hypothetical protein IQ03_01262 [Gemmobacter caeni]